MALLLVNMNYNKFHRWTSLPCTLSSWLCFQLLLHLLFIQSGMLVVVMGLRLESISVPQSGIKGSTITLSCEFRLDDDGEKLYSLKWYKDNHEFFRYMPRPQGGNPIRTFSRPGVLVDSTENRPISANRVVFKLKNLRMSSGGIYKCEISADKTFQTLTKESNLSVIVLPNPPVPLLTGFPQHAELGARIRGNCSFTKSYPSAKLTLFLNGAKVNKSDDMTVTMYEPRVDGVIEEYSLGGAGGAGSSSSSMIGGNSRDGIARQYQYQQQQQISSSSSSNSFSPSSLASSSSTSSIARRDGGINNGEYVGGSGANGIISVPEKTYTSVMGIEFHFNRRQYLRWGQNLNIRCVASVVDQMWDRQTNITLHNHQTSPQYTTAGRNGYSSGSEYLVPIISFVNVSFVSKTIGMALVIFTRAIFLC